MTSENTFWADYFNARLATADCKAVALERQASRLYDHALKLRALHDGSTGGELVRLTNEAALEADDDAKVARLEVVALLAKKELVLKLPDERRTFSLGDG